MPDPENMPLIGPLHRAVTPASRDQIPIFGDVWRSVNAVIDFMEYGCYPYWTVWVDALLPALGKMIIQILSFGMGDILRGYFRPTNLRGVGGMTRKPVRAKKLKAGKTAKIRRVAKPPEVGNALGKALPGSKMFQARKVTGFERYFWVIDMQIQRFFWY